MTGASKANVDEIPYVPASLALNQRPAVPGIRSTFGTGIVRTVDEGAVAPWNSLMWSLMTDACRAMGVRTDVPFRELTDKERDIVFHGPAAGAEGGYVIAEGTVKEISENKKSMIGEFLSGKANAETQNCISAEHMFDIGEIRLSTSAIHTVKPLEVAIPKGRLAAVTGVSGSGKTTMILESLIPALQSAIDGRKLPEHIKSVEAEGIAHVKLIDATPIGINVRSTGAISLDVQFLPDVNIPCPR
jgi:excinuclease ABC subunit A